MTLKEKFEQFTEQKSYDKKNYNAEECEQIADDYAIEFTEWVMNNCDEFTKQHQNLILRVFKKEKGL
jgi:hypothetical protein